MAVMAPTSPACPSPSTCGCPLTSMSTCRGTFQPVMPDTTQTVLLFCLMLALDFRWRGFRDLIMGVCAVVSTSIDCKKDGRGGSIDNTKRPECHWWNTVTETWVTDGCETVGTRRALVVDHRAVQAVVFLFLQPCLIHGGHCCFFLAGEVVTTNGSRLLHCRCTHLTGTSIRRSAHPAPDLNPVLLLSLSRLWCAAIGIAGHLSNLGQHCLPSFRHRLRAAGHGGAGAAHQANDGLRMGLAAHRCRLGAALLGAACEVRERE